MSFNYKFVFLVIAVHLSAAGAFADDLNPASAPETSKTNLVPGAEQVDELITNNNLRAYSGSVSRWSFASQSNYEGGTIQSPFSQDRPDISNASATTTKADFDSAVSGKYNINARNSVMAGIGIRWLAPFQSLTDYDGTRFDIANPYVQYQYIYKFLGVQAVLQAQLTQWTEADQTAKGYGQQFNIDQESVYAFGSTGISLGLSSFIQYTTFTKSASDPSPDIAGATVGTEQAQYQFYFAPYLEYQISEKLNFRTLVALFSYEHYRSLSNSLGFARDGVYQSIGLGWSVTRDIFLYPNIQFLPDHFQSSLTNVGLSATVNLF
jgi:hypothetical protein